MFEEMRGYRVILVTGPQRAGTAIASKMIAEDTGHKYIAEHDFGGFSVPGFKKAISEHNVVIQCPTMSGRIEDFTTDDMLGVFMFRDLDDIARSEDRIGWSVGVYHELYNYGRERNAARTYRQQGGRTAPLKYRLWIKQKLIVEHYRDLDYESLSKHPMWVSTEERIYNGKQTAGKKK